jgi:hypothetical protein
MIGIEIRSGWQVKTVRQIVGKSIVPSDALFEHHLVDSIIGRFGNSVGGCGSLIFGSGLAAVGLFLQRNWAQTVYPWLESNGWHGPIGLFLEAASHPFNPYIMWEMNPVKFPINSYELYFPAMISPWPVEWWSTYFFITQLLVSGLLGIIATLCFLIGGVIDLRALFRDLATRSDNPLDNGVVEGHVSIVDKAKFEARTGQKQDD